MHPVGDAISNSYTQKLDSLEGELKKAKEEYDRISTHLQNELIYGDRLREQLEETQTVLSRHLNANKVPHTANFGKYLAVKTENQKLVQRIKGYEQKRNKKAALRPPQNFVTKKESERVIFPSTLKPSVNQE